MKKSFPSSGSERPDEASSLFPSSPLEPLLGAGDRWMELLREAEEERPGGRIGGYEILEEIRAGGQGLVFRARCRAAGREVALKRLAAGAFATSDVRRRFEREIDAVTSLAHPGIVTVHGVELIDGELLFSMEWVDGEPLTAWASRLPPGRAGIRSALGAFLQVCEAVQHAHRSGVIHRDLKPDNVLMDRDGRCRVLDFGLARRLPEDGEDGFTRTQGFAGTPAYCAPEHFAGGAVPLDVRTDVYALGVVLFEMLTGQRPHKGARLRELIEAIEEREPPRPSSLAEGVGRELDTIVRKALAKRPEDRYQSVHALADDVQRHLERRPVMAMPPSFSYQLASWVRRHRLVFALSVALLVLAFLSAGFGLRQAAIIAAERDQARFQEGRADDARRAAVAALAEAEEEGRRKAEALERAEYETRKARSVQDFYLDAIYLAASPDRSAGTTDVVGVLEYAAERAEAHFGDQLEVAVEVRAQVARTFVFLSRFEEAEELVEETLALQATLPEPALGTRAMLIQTKGEIVHFTGDSAGALPYLQEAVATYRSIGDPPPLPRSLSSALSSLAGLEHTLGLLEDSEVHWREAMALLDDTGMDHPTSLVSREQFASLLIDRGKHDEAVWVLLEAIQIGESVHGPDHPIVGGLSHTLGVVYWQTQRAEESLPYLQRSLATYRELLPEGDPDLAWECFYLGRSLRDVGRAEEAIEAFELALELGSVPEVNAHARRGVAECRGLQGDYGQAAELYGAACREYRDVLPPENGLRVEVLVDWFGWTFVDGQRERAEEIFEEFLDEARTCALFEGYPRDFYVQRMRIAGRRVERAAEVEEVLAEVVEMVEEGAGTDPELAAFLQEVREPTPLAEGDG